MNTNSDIFSNSGVDLKEIVSTYTKHWKWFIISVIGALLLAYVYIRYATPEYAAKAKIQILDEKGSSSELSVFKDLDFLGGGKSNVEDEIEILNSRSNFIEVVKDLNLNIRVTALGNVKDSEIYKERPFIINFIANDTIIHRSDFDFFIEINSETTFGYSEERDSPLKVYSYGKKIPTEIGDIVIIPNFPFFKSYKGEKVKVSVRPIFDIAEDYQSKLNVTLAEEYSNILNITLNDAIEDKAVDIINTLIFTYNKNAIEDKKAVADKTSQFINNRIDLIATTLTSVDEDAQQLMTDKRMTGSGLEVGAAVQMSAQSRQALEEAKNQLTTVNGYKQYVQNSGFDVIPAVPVGDPNVAQTTAKYNELILQRKRLLESSTEKSPIVRNIDSELAELKGAITSSLAQIEQSTGMSVSALQNQVGTIYGTISSAPKNQAELREITRQQQTTESLYLYLLQKREEAQITFASSSPKSKVIDEGYIQGKHPVKPKKTMIYLASMILGFLLPLGIIYGNDLLDNKIHNKNSLEKLIKDVPVLAELPKLGKKDETLVRKDDRSVLGESLRILRTNLDYLIKSKKSAAKNNIIFVTSSVPGEGKTFLSSNLSMIFANTDKKVLLIGADIRNPKLYTFFSSKDVDKLGKPSRNKDAGLTEFLYDDSLTSKDIINPMLAHTNTIDVIYSGKIPPNPAELLMSARMKELIQEMSERYDYVVVDTAPLMVVSDTLLISEYADHIIYVTRAGVTETRVLEFPLKLKNEGKLKGLSFVVNDVKEANLGYGGKYGYGYGKTTKKWWKF